MANDIEVIFSGQEAIDVTVDLSTISGSLRIFNSDESFDQTITEDTELSDIVVGDSLTSPSNINVAVDTWDKLVDVAGGIGYNYGHDSGVTTIYETGDDASAETDIFRPARIANKLLPKNSLASFFVLNNNNSFGNTDRFTDDAGGQSYANSVVVDNYTGLSWFYLATQVVWATAIADALASTQGGYSDWVLASKSQIETLVNIAALYSPEALSYSPLSIVIGTGANGIWTSTTLAALTTSAFEFVRTGDYNFVAKTPATRRQLYCRKHF
jgi:hypothetical protein